MFVPRALAVATWTTPIDELMFLLQPIVAHALAPGREH